MTDKLLHINIYHMVFDQLGINVIRNDELTNLSINIEIKVEEVIKQTKTLIIEKYMDGMYITTEDFSDESFLNVYLLFGNEYQFLVDYYKSIDTKRTLSEKNEYQNSSFSNVYFKIEDTLNEDELKKLEIILSKNGLELELQSTNIRVFEKGASDFQKSNIFVIIGEKVGEILIEKLLEYIFDNTLKKNKEVILPVNPNDYLKKASELSGEHERFIKFSNFNKRSESENIYDIVFISRRNKTIISVDADENEIVESCIKPRNQTWI